MKLLIVGAGSVGGFISYNISEFGTYEIVGFLDDDETKLGKVLFGHEVLGTTNDIDRHLSKHSSLAVVIGIASPLVKMIIAERLANTPLLFPNFISKSSWLSERVKLGKGVIIYPGVSINYDTVIEDFSIINMNCAVGHNCKISRYSTLAPAVKMAGHTLLKEGADVGIGAATIQNIIIGKYALVGGQSMVIKDVPDHAVVVGNPARVIKNNTK
jgi:sugar O-acyltransferase (sialic acid O-acetyltransferase NeuD family)